MEHSKVTRFVSRAVFLAGAFVLGCTPAMENPEPSTPAKGPLGAKAPEAKVTGAIVPNQPPAAQPNPTSLPAKTAGEKGDATKPIPDSLKALKEKLQPSNLPSQQPSAPAKKTEEVDAKLLEGAERIAKSFVQALQKGDVEGATKLTFTKEQFEKLVSPGYREILEGNVLSENQTRINMLSEKLKGKEIKVTWKPGSVTKPPNLFKESLPLMSNGTLALEMSGVAIEVLLDQMVYAENKWTIFRMSTP